MSADESAAGRSVGVHWWAVGVMGAVGIAVVAVDSIEGESVGVSEQLEAMVDSEGDSDRPRGRTENK